MKNKLGLAGIALIAGLNTGCTTTKNTEHLVIDTAEQISSIQDSNKKEIQEALTIDDIKTEELLSLLKDTITYLDSISTDIDKTLESNYINNIWSGTDYITKLNEGEEDELKKGRAELDRLKLLVENNKLINREEIIIELNKLYTFDGIIKNVNEKRNTIDDSEWTID